MAWIITLCSMIMVGLDYLTLQHLCSDKRKCCRWMVLLGIIDTLPASIGAPTFLLSVDNSIVLQKAYEWGCFVYMILGVARQPINLALLLGKSRALRAAGIAVSTAVMAIFIYGAAVTRTDYKINHLTLSSSRLPASFDGYRVVQFTDLHLGSLLNSQKETERVVELCNSLNADMVTFCGDLTHIRHSEIAPNLASILSKLESRDGIYSVLGNHDIGVYVRDSIALPPRENTRRVIEAEQQMGWQVLDDATTYITRGEDSISITGISFSQTLQEERHSANLPEVDFSRAYEGVSTDLYNITLSHIPQLWDRILELHPADLTLSGHTHAMQVAVRVGQRRLSPAAIIYKRWSGLYEEEGKYLYINDGIGNVMFPMRVGARPEITLFELRSEK